MEASVSYEHVKELLVYAAFGGIIGINLFSYGYLVYHGIRLIAKGIRKYRNKNSTREENGNVCN